MLLSGQYLSSEVLADERHGRGLRCVVFVKFAACNQRDLHGVEIAGARHTKVRHHYFVWRRGAPLDRIRNAGQNAAQWKCGDETNCFDSWQTLEPWPQLLMKRDDSGAVGIICFR